MRKLAVPIYESEFQSMTLYGIEAASGHSFHDLQPLTFFSLHVYFFLFKKELIKDREYVLLLICILLYAADEKRNLFSFVALPMRGPPSGFAVTSAEYKVS